MLHPVWFSASCVDLTHVTMVAATQFCLQLAHTLYHDLNPPVIYPPVILLLYAHMNFNQASVVFFQSLCLLRSIQGPHCLTGMKSNTVKVFHIAALPILSGYLQVCILPLTQLHVTLYIIQLCIGMNWQQSTCNISALSR